MKPAPEVLDCDACHGSGLVYNPTGPAGLGELLACVECHGNGMVHVCGDPTCPAPEGDPCHYADNDGTKAMARFGYDHRVDRRVRGEDRETSWRMHCGACSWTSRWVSRQHGPKAVAKRAVEQFDEHWGENHAR